MPNAPEVTVRTDALLAEVIVGADVDIAIAAKPLRQRVAEDARMRPPSYGLGKFCSLGPEFGSPVSVASQEWMGRELELELAGKSEPAGVELAGGIQITDREADVIQPKWHTESMIAYRTAFRLQFAS